MEKRRKFITIDQAIRLINESWGLEGRDYVKTSTIYGAIWKKKIKNYGRGNLALLDPDEVLAVYGNKTA